MSYYSNMYSTFCECNTVATFHFSFHATCFLPQHKSNPKQAKDTKRTVVPWRTSGFSGVPTQEMQKLVVSGRHSLKNHKYASSPFDVFLWWDINPDGNNRPLWTIKKSNLSVTTPKARRGSAFVNKLFPRVDEAASAGSLMLSGITNCPVPRDFIVSLSGGIFHEHDGMCV